VIEEYTGDVVGKYEKNGAVRFYPNAHVLTTDLKSVFSREEPQHEGVDPHGR
jgi:hypothetical protein